MLRNGLEPWHLLILAVVVVVLFGSRKLPDTARSLGKSLRILKSEAKAMKEEIGKDSPAATASAAATATTAGPDRGTASPAEPTAVGAGADA
ncbi:MULTISPECIES: Sec-independent protein translocase subunit TatA [Streptomyces]|uniref:Sec-independent protein translocase subunit TatA n=1 Tax=Streptomyces TaxID=1883 RepID=UPI0029B30219|nr:Sec-independent protein translocase subunit TatA [Streptomyces sp. WI03-4A]MDX2595824.1 Sec-independent protein translocase subunit TatA [Streptomyces sp. WI03-4A]